MKTLILIITLLGNLRVTSYRSIPSQTDSSPYYTSIGERVHPHGVAVSRDLLKRWGGPLEYGDTIYIEGYGFKVVNDCMAAKNKKAIDIWVQTWEQERTIGIKYRHVWIVKPASKGK